MAYGSIMMYTCWVNYIVSQTSQLPKISPFLVPDFPGCPVPFGVFIHPSHVGSWRLTRLIQAQRRLWVIHKLLARATRDPFLSSIGFLTSNWCGQLRDGEGRANVAGILFTYVYQEKNQLNVNGSIKIKPYIDPMVMWTCCIKDFYVGLVLM